MSEQPPLAFRGGLAGALAPFALFLAGVAWLGIAGAPDERGFWPILVAALALGTILARDPRRYCEAAIAGAGRPIVALMIFAWLLAGILASLLAGSGFLGSLVWLADGAGLAGGGWVVAAFLVACAVSMATGTSLGTLLLCAPLLYPAGGALGAEPAMLIGALLAGATFGDNLSPISDTTIASAGTQEADLGGVVRSRLPYALPAAAIALVLFAWLGGGGPGLGSAAGSAAAVAADPAGAGPLGLTMLLAPALALALLLAGRHLVEGLLWGSLAAAAIGLATGLLAPSQLLFVDTERFLARGLLLEGLERGIGISIFTLLLAGLTAGLEASGLLDRLVGAARRHATSRRKAEGWIFGAASAAVLLTTHSVVAILTVGRFTRETGERFGISAYRRANLLDVTVCTYPFLLPYFIPTLLAASLTGSAEELGMPRLSPLAAGLHNFHSWGLLVVVVVAVVTGWPAAGRAPDRTPDEGR